MNILAIDLGKFNSMCCFFDTNTQEHRLQSASTLDFGGASGCRSLCRPYTNTATLDTEPRARSYSGGVSSRLSSNHFQYARASFCSSPFPSIRSSVAGSL